MATQKGNKIKILSANCRGIQSKEKRYDVINYMKSKNADILCLQDTHLITEEEFNLKTIWDGEVILHGMRTNSRGVAILLNNTFEHTIQKVVKDPTGNMIALDLTLSDITVKLINIYGPNVDDINFYNTINSILNENEQEYVIWCGDFNMTLNPQLDSFNYSNVNNPKARTTTLNIIEEHNLIDTYTYCYPDSKRYTWRRHNPLKQARLDYFIVSSSLTDLIRDVDIKAGYRSDHSILELNIYLNKFEVGKGIWKFNTHLLKDMEYINLINKSIQEEITKYAVPVYNLDNINEILEEHIDLTISEDLFLEMLVLRMRGETIKFSSYKKKEENKKEKQLLNEIEQLEKENYLTNSNILHTKKRVNTNKRN